MSQDPEVQWAPGAAAPLAAARIARLLRGHRAPRFAVPGGRSAAAVFDALAALPPDQRPDWPAVELYFVDERAVPPGDAESNYRLARERLAERVGIPDGGVHRMRAEEPDLERAAREYETLLGAPLDVILLGVGEDGHIASLFPGSPLLDERGRRVAAVFGSPKPPARRLTILPPVLEQARELVVIAEGESRKDAVRRALAWQGSAAETPARLARRGRWFVGAMGPPPPAIAG